MCILDEMNLSHPEQYLAPVLSAMEREDGNIPLHAGDGDEYGVPPSIRRSALEKCQAVLRERSLTRCADKVAELIQDLNETGSFRFWR